MLIALAAGLGSLAVTVRRREPCRVRAVPDGWSHHYREGVTVAHRWGGPSARREDASARELFLFDYEPGPGDRIVDIGAGTGGEARLFSRLAGPAGRLVCVEAHPRTFGLLAQTIALNRLGNVTALPLAVTGTAGTVHIEDDPDAHVANGLTDAGRGIAVPGVTLAEVLERAGLDRVDLLKLNIEGAELAALRAPGPLRRVRHIVVSCHDFRADAGSGGDGMRTFAPVRELLLAAGFTLRTRPHDPRPWVRHYLYGRR
jgi:FkbM family methyltransferase